MRTPHKEKRDLSLILSAVGVLVALTQSNSAMAGMVAAFLLGLLLR